MRFLIGLLLLTSAFVHAEVVSQHSELHVALLKAAQHKYPECKLKHLNIKRVEYIENSDFGDYMFVRGQGYKITCETYEPDPEPNPTPDPDPTPQPEPPVSYASGVAPLGVHFDAGEWDFSKTFTWNFGDDQGQVWATSGKSKNSDSGPIAAHVYDNQGRYTATLTVSDDSGVLSVKQYSVVVDDPDVVFAGDKTTCISTVAANDFDGCPGGARKIKADNLVDVRQYVGSGKRLLFRRGDMWLAKQVSWYSNISGFAVSAYGECQNRSDMGICANDPLFELAGSDVGNVFHLHKSQKCQFTNLRFIALEGNSGLGTIGGDTDLSEILIYRVQSHGVTLGNANWQTQGHNQLMFVSCDISETKGNGIFTGSEKLVLLGNQVKNSRSTHVVRVWQAYKGVIAHNHMSGASLDNSNGRHAFKLHGPSEAQVKSVGTDPLGLRHRTRFVVVSSNLFGGSGPWPVAIGPQDGAQDERLSDILFEHNHLLAGYGDLSSTKTRISLHLWARDVMARNNIFDARGGHDSEYTAAVVKRRGVEPAPQSVRLIDNQVILSDTFKYGNGVQVFVVSKDATETAIKRNVATTAKAATGPVVMISNQSPDLSEADNVFKAD